MANFFPATYSTPTLTSTPQTWTDESANPVLKLTVATGTVSTVTPPQSSAPTISGLSIDTQSDPGERDSDGDKCPRGCVGSRFLSRHKPERRRGPGHRSRTRRGYRRVAGLSAVVANDSVAGADPAFLVVPSVGGTPSAAGTGPGTAPSGGNPVGMPPGPFPPGIPLGPNDDIIYGAPSLTRSSTDAPVSMFHQDQTGTIEGTDDQNETDTQTSRSVVVGGGER